MSGRRLLRWVGGLLLLPALVIGVLFIPAVQKAIFVAVVSGADREVAVEELRVGFDGVRVEGLEFSGSGLLLRVPRLELSLSWRALVGRRLEVRSLVAEDLYIRLPAEPPDEEEEEDKSADEGFRLPEDFRGVLSGVSGFRVDEMTLAGVALVPGRGEVDFRLEGRGIGPGGEGTFMFSLDPREEVDETVPGLRVEATVAMGPEGGLESVAFGGDLLSRVPSVEGKLTFEGALVETDAGESYHCRVFSEELFAGGEIVVRGGWDHDARALEAGVSASAQNLDFLGPFVEEPLPGVSFALTGSTRIEAGGTLRSADLHLSGESDPGAVPGFDRAVSLAGRLLLATDGEEGLMLEEMDFSLRPTGESDEWVGLRLAGDRPLALGAIDQLPPGAIAVLDIALPGGFLNSMAEGWRFSALTGSWTVAGDGDGVVFESPDDWRVGVRRAGEGAPEALVGLAPKIRYSAARAELELPVEVSSKGAVLGVVFSGGADPANREEVGFTLSAEGGLAALRPFGGAGMPDVSGRVRADGSGSWTGSLSLAGGIAADGFRLGDAPAADLEIRLADGRIDSSDASGGIRSEGEVDLEWRSGGAESTVEGLGFALRLPEDEGRPRLSVPGGSIRLDPASLAGWKRPDSAGEGGGADDGAAAPRSGGLPGPDVFSFLRTPPVLPLDLERLALEFACPLGGEWWTVSVEASDLVAGSEGTFAVAIESGESGGGDPEPGPTVAGTTSLGSGGGLDRLALDAEIPGGWTGAAFPELFASIRYSPRSPAEALAFSAGAGDSAGDPLVTGTVDSSGGEVLLRAETDFAAWMRTPLRRFLPNLSTGRMKTLAKLTPDGVSMDLGLDGAAPADAFESYDLRMDGLLQSLTPLDLQAAVVLTDAKDKRSDVRLEGRGSRGNGFEMDLSGDRVDREALEGFVRIWTPPAGEEPEAAPGPAADPEPWPLADLATPVSVRMAFGEILPGPVPAFREVEGELSVNRSRVSLRFSGDWMDGAATSGEARAEWDGSRVDGTLVGKLDSVAVGRLLREMDPGRTPPLEGRFDLAFSFDGVSPDLAGLPDRMVGKLVLTGRDGLIRSLRPEARVTRMVEVGSVAGILLADTLNRPGVAALGEVAGLFKKIPFDEMVFELNRTPEKATELPSIRLRGPYFSMEGRGGVEPSDLAGIPTTPMHLTLDLGAKPPLLRQLQILDLVGTETDEVGYRLWKDPVRLSGTFANPDTGELWSRVIAAVERVATLKSRDLRREDEARGDDPGATPEDPRKRKRPEEELIEEGVNRLFDILGG
ncbi:MAG: hypothetical protein ACLFSZ_08355 [Puniceicoccaceae bacterium]